jgi:hypothetical protein
MKRREESTVEPQFELTVDGVQWERVASFDQSDSDSRVYVLDRETGRIRFGDGEHGRAPSSESRIRATYRFGGGSGGATNEPAIALTWTFLGFLENEVIVAMVEPQADGVTFRAKRGLKVPHRWKWTRMLCWNIKRWALRLA